MPDVQKQSRHVEIHQRAPSQLQAARLYETAVQTMRCSGEGEEGDSYYTSCSSSNNPGRGMQDVHEVYDKEDTATEEDTLGLHHMSTGPQGETKE